MAIAAISPSRTAASAPGTVLNALTIDVEDYYQVSGFEDVVARDCWPAYESRVVASTHTILRLLDQAEVRGTFFILGYVADRHPELVRAIHRAGHEIASHGYWHRLIYRQTPDEFRADVRRSKDCLQAITGEAVTAYRAPSFSITRRNLWALDVLIEEGFALDSSIYPTVHDRYGIADAPVGPHTILRAGGTIAEFPPPVWRYGGVSVPVAGGGYFRLYPYWLTRQALGAINATGRPAAIYLHPWELDPDQPRIAAGRLRTFRHYVNLRHTEQRLRRLLADFPLTTLSQAAATAISPASTWQP